MTEKEFRTAKELQITEKQRCALVKTLQLLESGSMIHVTTLVSGDFYASLDIPLTCHFNMRHWRSEDKSCGTICCIGGTAELVGQVDLRRAVNKNIHLHDLFYPSIPTTKWVKITPALAAVALRNYLFTGDAKWTKTMEGHLS